MKNAQRVSELLVETGAYKDLDSPVILTSGELGIYYINTEKLLQDSGEWVRYGDNSQDMITYLKGLLPSKSSFNEVINIISEEIDSRLSHKKELYKNITISGGQRRDWLFSGPVACVMGLNHISLYKQIDDVHRFEIISPKGDLLSNCDIRGCYAVHVVDLITEGSSVYRQNGIGAKGWVPMLRAHGAVIDSLLSVVTRRQGGEERLLEQGVTTNSFVSIDNDFLRKYSKDPERALDYAKSPSEWTKNYIEKNDVMTFVDVFNPDGGKLERGLKFLSRYKTTLSSLGKLEKLERAIRVKFDLELNPGV